MRQPERLVWRWLGERRAEAFDGRIRYCISKRRSWHVTMNGCPIGDGDFPSFEAAAWYVDYGGTPPRIERDKPPASHRGRRQPGECAEAMPP